MAEIAGTYLCSNHKQKFIEQLFKLNQDNSVILKSKHSRAGEMAPVLMNTFGSWGRPTFSSQNWGHIL